MMRTYFRQLLSGRLARLPFIGYTLLLMVISVAVVAGIGLAIGLSEQWLGGDLAAAQQQLTQWFSIPAMMVTLLLGGALAFASLNLMAKRLRDIGLPAWWMLAILYLLETVISLTLSNEAAAILHSIATLFLLIAPGGLFERRVRSQFGDRDF